jgi:hypothetical protein
MSVNQRVLIPKTIYMYNILISPSNLMTWSHCAATQGKTFAETVLQYWKIPAPVAAQSWGIGHDHVDAETMASDPT